MNDVVLLSAVRSPIGRRKGGLSGAHPVDLLGHVLTAAVDRAGLTPADVTQVLAGCVTQAGAQGYNIARNAALAAGFPAEVPGSTIDAQCGSSQQAVNLGAALVASGAAEVVVAAGVESMSRLPLGTAVEAGPGEPLNDAYRARYEVVHQGESAERIADRWNLDRRACDEFALASQDRAAEAWATGRFDREVLPLAGVTRDEGLRASSLDGLGGLKPAFRSEGRLTAGSSSQLSDGAAAVVLTSAAHAAAVGLRPRARILAQATVGVDPVLKLTGPIPATRAILARTGLSLADIDRFEVNEAFASVVLAWQAELGADPDRVNVNGGAIALGHPVGATGARLVTTALHELERSGTDRALVTMCCGGGLGTATLLSMID
ncbi:acetyl-CoA C-acyltransferase [Actinomadura sp. KC345]|uniref:thiolase family protein n=1 Tax=Actinomadura sp. KC345 TaxID=2530371 RepID=UPI0010470FA6|nr:acetyl-CoA C-acyltransferase [Actinomadura sp. KC345]TDC58546.1 acetyl-CoA C-acyltransferase [Actinomadura sp. KC345]